MSETRIPTNSLRFIERDIPCIDPGFYGKNRPRARVLQQMFLTTGGKQFWEDVPLVDEPEGSTS